MAPSAVFRADTDAPIRSELFSAERLEQHAETLAAAQHVVARGSACRQLTTRLRDNGRVLLANHRGVEPVARDERALPPAYEWLLAHLHLALARIRPLPKTLQPASGLAPSFSAIA